MAHLIIEVIVVAFTIFLPAPGNLVDDECKAWAPRLAEWLIACAVARLPEDQRGLYREHWQSDVNDMPGDLSKIFWAARCILAAGKILPETEEKMMTGIGSFLRSSDIDSTPVLLNVLKGETSVFAPDNCSWARFCGERALALLLLSVMLPLFLIIPIVIRLGSRGPVFLSQKRVGRNGRPFRVLKFRTMRVPPQPLR